MTPLHWAAYHGEPNLVKLFCENDALQTASVHGHRPVDIAGFCKKKEAVKQLAYNLALKILHRETQIANENYTVTFDGRRVLWNKTFTQDETDAFKLILMKGSRIHAYFAMKNVDKLDPKKVEADLDYTEAEDINSKGYDCRQDPKVFKCGTIEQSNSYSLPVTVDEGELRIIYWAAFYGLTEYVRWALIAN